MRKSRYRSGNRWAAGLFFLIVPIVSFVCIAAAGENAYGRAAYGMAVERHTFARDTTDSATVIDDGFIAFWQRFREAVAANNRQAVAAMTYFPFSSYDLPSIAGKPKHEPQFTRAEFLKYYDKLFNKLAKKLIAVSTPTPMTNDDDVVNRYAVGIRHGKNYTMWIEFWRDESGAWFLTRTDNVSYGD